MAPISPTNTPYRDTKSTLASRLEKLHDELTVIQETRSEIEALTHRESEVRAEIAQLTAELAKAQAKRQLPLLASAYVATPCKANWDEMVGDERTRFCNTCSKHVHNLSEMSFAEAESFLQQLTGDACVRLYRRNDGTVMTRDCPVGVRNKRVKRAAAALVGTGIAAAGLNMAQPPPAVVAGGISMPERIPPVQRRVQAPEAPEAPLQPMPMGTIAPIARPPAKVLHRGPQLIKGPSRPANPQGIQGATTVSCTITTDGKTRDCKVLNGPEALHQPTLDMIAQQVYLPALRQGIPVEVTHKIFARFDKSSPQPNHVLGAALPHTTPTTITPLPDNHQTNNPPKAR